MTNMENQILPLVDSAGRALLSIEEWNNLPDDRKNYLRYPIQKNIKIRKKVIQIDHSFVDIIKQVNDYGFYTTFCCSGLIADHPNLRHEKYYKRDNVQKGKRIIQHSTSYIVFIDIEHEDYSQGRILIEAIEGLPLKYNCFNSPSNGQMVSIRAIDKIWTDEELLEVWRKFIEKANELNHIAHREMVFND